MGLEALAAEPAASRAASGSSVPSALLACCLCELVPSGSLPTEPVWYSTTQSWMSLRFWVGGSKWLSIGAGPGAEVVPSRLGCRGPTPVRGSDPIVRKIVFARQTP